MPGFLEEPGLLSEVTEQVRVVEAQEGIPILSGLTNCVRVGDLLVFCETGEGREITVREVKKKKQRTERFRRQRDRQNELVTLLDEREGKLEKEEFKITVRDVEQETYLPSVLNLLQEAQNKGAAGRTFDNYLRVDCLDLRYLREDPIEELARQAASTCDQWEKNGDWFVPMSNVDLKLPSVNVAPYSVFPFPPSFRAALLTNAMAIVSTLNVTEVLRRIEKRGWTIVKDPQTIITEVTSRGGDPRREAGLAHIEREACSMTLPPSLAGRLSFEFLRPRSVLRELEQIFNEGPLPGGERFLSTLKANLLQRKDSDGTYFR